MSYFTQPDPDRSQLLASLPHEWHSASLSSSKKKSAFLNSVRRACFPDYLSFQIPLLYLMFIFGFVFSIFCLCFEGIWAHYVVQATFEFIM